VAATRLAAFEVGVAAPAESTPSSLADEDFRLLKAQLRAEGLFKPTWRFYCFQVAWLAALFASVLALTAAPHALLRLGGGVALGLFWQQAAFVGHDAGHCGITGCRAADQAIGLLCGNVLTGTRPSLHACFLAR
jgi:delta8-fatty-acid desaturase